jgi:hypothetical protein
MSKSSKLQNKEKRLQKKRAIKMANKARYAELARTGQNTKSKRFLRGTKRHRLVKMTDHPDGACGNPACRKCFPEIYRVA